MEQFLKKTAKFIVKNLIKKEATAKQTCLCTQPLQEIKTKISDQPWHCPYLQGHFMMTYHGEIGYCRPQLLYTATPFHKFSWDSFFKKRNEHKYDLEEGFLGKCEGCTYIKEGKYNESKYKFNFLDLNFSSFCNLRCLYCYIPQEDLAKRDLDFEKKRLKVIKQILDKKMFDPNGGVSFSGGEPTIASVFEETCSLLRKYSPNISYTFVTNCTYLSPEIIKLMRSEANVCLMISIDAPNKDLYAKIKGRDLFDKAIKNLKEYLLTAKQYPNNHINLKCILMHGNLKHISDFLDMAKNLGVEKIYYDIDNRTTHREKRLQHTIPAAIEFCIEARKRNLEPIAESTGLSLQELKDRINQGVQEAQADFLTCKQI